MILFIIAFSYRGTMIFQKEMDEVQSFFLNSYLYRGG